MDWNADFAGLAPIELPTALRAVEPKRSKLESKREHG
jgi:hypothetical protein